MCGTPFRLNIIAEACVSHDTEDLADLTLLDELTDLNAKGEVASPDSFHKEEILLAGNLDEDLSLSSVDGEGFLAENILARLQRESDILVVAGVRGRDVDDIDVGVGHKSLVVTICGARGCDSPSRDELLGLFLGRGRGDGDDLVGYVRGIADIGVDEKIICECCWGIGYFIGSYLIQNIVEDLTLSNPASGYQSVSFFLFFLSWPGFHTHNTPSNNVWRHDESKLE